MHALLLSSLLAVTAAPSAAPVISATETRAAAAPAIPVHPAPVLALSPALQAPPLPSMPTSSSTTSLIMGLGVIALLALSTALVARKKIRQPRLLRVLETTSVGIKRSLVLARVADQTLLLGVSEAGITLLGAPMGPMELPTTEPATEPVQSKLPKMPAWLALRSYQKTAKQPVTNDFAMQLESAAEDQELREKFKALRGERPT